MNRVTLSFAENSIIPEQNAFCNQQPVPEVVDSLWRVHMFENKLIRNDSKLVNLSLPI